MDYEIFHDESTIAGYWHGIFLVPVKTKEILVDLLEQARKNQQYFYPISIKKIAKEGKIYGCASSWVGVTYFL